MAFKPPLGEENINKYGTLMKVIEYNSKNDILVEFQDNHKYVVHTNIQRFRQGRVGNPFDKTVYGKGYLGVGEYQGSIEGVQTPQYKEWRGMLTRCYSNEYHKSYPTYINTQVCEEWLDFQNFAKWYEDNYYEVDNQAMHLDKDIITKGNKLYCPDKCVFVPHELNLLFTKNDSKRGQYLIGVYYDKSRHKFKSACRRYGKKVGLGSFDNEEEAFYAYKEFKEETIRLMAEEYKDKIPMKLYNGLMSYKVEKED